MKTQYALSAAALALSLVAGAAVARDLALEPAINGGVSANGLYPTQALQDRGESRDAELALEPCINGAVSASGNYVSQAAEDAARAAGFASTSEESPGEAVR
jgi:hypothetical protein